MMSFGMVSHQKLLLWEGGFVRDARFCLTYLYYAFKDWDILSPIESKMRSGS